MTFAAVLPRALQHQGLVRASGFLLSSELLGPRERLARALELFEPGVHVQALSATHWLVRLPRARAVVCEAQHGVPLTTTASGHLAAAPLSAREIAAAFDLYGPSLLWLRGGVLQQTPFTSCPEIDLASELVLPELRVVELHTLAEPPAAITLAVPEAPRAVRELLSDHVPPPSAERERALQALRELSERAPDARRVRGSMLASLGRALGSMSRAAIAAGGWLARMRARLGAGAARPGRAARTLRAPPRPSGPTAIQRAWSAFTRALANLAARSPLGTFLGFRQARYLRDMLRRFESGDLADALRHAIPLSAAAALNAKRTPALGTPDARTDLTINPWRASGSVASYLFSGELYDHLRNTYRAAAKRFEAQGRLHEAAFVYAELLDDAATAIAMLERAGAFRQAAELAEGRKLGAATVVRLWFLAKEVDRAVDFAIRHDAFTSAIHELASRDAAAARALRLVWAKRLASAGRYVEAIDAIWTVDAARHVAEQWLMKVIALGGVPAARALARAIRTGRGEPAMLDASFRAQLQEQGYEAARCRLELARQLVETHDQGRAAAARYLPALTRALVADLGEGTVELDWTLEKALHRGDDRALIADLPRNLAAHASRRPRLARDELRWEHDDVGTVAIYDAVRTAHGGYALALGETGIRVLTRDGRVRAHFAQPAEQLVSSDSGAVAIALTQRGSLQRLAHVDFVRVSAEHWADVAIDSYARDYDGDRWFVRAGKEILCLDTQRTDLRAVWHVGDDAFMQAHLERTPKELLIIADVSSAIEMWRYDLPSLTFRKRTSVAGPAERDDVLASDAAGSALVLGSVADEPGDLTLFWRGTHMPLVETAHLQVTRLAVIAGQILVTYRSDRGLVMDVVSVSPLQRVLRIAADGATRLSAHVDERGLIVADDRGRLLHYDLSAMNVVSDLRIFV